MIAIHRADPTNAPSPGAVGPVSLTTTSMISVIGHLTWLGALWAVVAVGYSAGLGAIAIWGSLDESLWAEAVAGWQRWPIGGAGVTMATVFGPMFITNGVTRARLAQSAIGSMIVLAVLGSLYVTIGFAIESAVFDANDWTHRVNDMRLFDEVGLWRAGLSYALVFAAYFVGGWLVGLAFHRVGWLAMLFVPLAAVPAVVSEVCLMLDFGTQFDVLDQTSTMPLWLGAAISAAVTAACAVGASRWTRELRIT